VILFALSSGDCSLFLLRVILTPASLHAPQMSVRLRLCQPLAAQRLLSPRPSCLHDFLPPKMTLVDAAGIPHLEHGYSPTPQPTDLANWFHNAIRLAPKLDIRNTCVSYSGLYTVTFIAGTISGLFACVSRDKPRKVLRCIRRIWWSLYVRPSSRHPCFLFFPALCLLCTIFRDFFHSAINTRRSRLTRKPSALKP